MICGTFTMSGIPTANVDAIVAGFKANKPPPKSVTKTQDQNGDWTVVAEFDPCPSGTSHNTGS